MRAKTRFLVNSAGDSASKIFSQYMSSDSRLQLHTKCCYFSFFKAALWQLTARVLLKKRHQSLGGFESAARLAALRRAAAKLFAIFTEEAAANWALQVVQLIYSCLRQRKRVL